MRDGTPSIPPERMTLEGWPKIIGARVQRLEDSRLLQGLGRFTADIKLPNMAHVAFKRSDQAHAKIVSIETGAACATPGVIGVYTADDLNPLVTLLKATSKTPNVVETPMPPLATGKVRYVGEPVVAIVAENRYIAEDAAALIELTLAPLPVACDPELAARTGAPLLHEKAGTNVLAERGFGQGDMDAVLTSAAVVVGGAFRMTRKSPSPIEGRVCVADWDRGRDTLTLFSATQVPGIIRDNLAQAFGITANSVHVIAPDVGGGFGAKGYLYCDELSVCALAKIVGRPLKWVGDRLEDLVSTYQAFDERVEAYLAFDADGHIIGLQAESIGDAGAYSIYPWTAAMEPAQVISFLPGPYRVPAYRARTRAVATPKVPMGAYRGVGRPTAAFVMERLIDLGARKLGLDPLEVRRRNLVSPEEFPYKTASGIVWDRSGFTEALKAAAGTFDYDERRAEQKVLRAQGRLVGIGLACYAELTGIGSRISIAPGVPLNTGVESAMIRIDSSGAITAAFGIASHGQGHETSLAQVVAQELGCRVEDVKVLHGDSNLVAHGIGTFASRGAVLAGGAATSAARVLRQNVLTVAAYFLEAAECDLELAGGKIKVIGTDKETTLSEVARRYYFEMSRQLRELRERHAFEVTRSFDPYLGTTATATHAVMVEVDPVTWGVRILKYVVAEDCGRVINPMIVDGQVHGGVAQGVGAALLEEVVHNDEGQVLTGSLMDYLLPTSVEVPAIDVIHVESVNPDNLTGFRGMGEGGTIGAPAAIANAVNDALSGFDIDVRELPLTPERIFRLVDSRRQRPSPE